MRLAALALVVSLAGAATAQAPVRPVAAPDFRLSGQAVQGGALLGNAPAGTVTQQVLEVDALAAAEAAAPAEAAEAA